MRLDGYGGWGALVSHGGAVGVFARVDKREGLSWFGGWGDRHGAMWDGGDIGRVCQFVTVVNCHVFIDRKGFIW